MSYAHCSSFTRCAGRATVIGLALACHALLALAEEPARFRTDANPDKSLPWFQLVEGQFPPEGSAHAISGELIQVDHLERRFLLRVDRNDSQDRGVWDLPLDGVMLPYGSIWYHGAPAALQDIPLGAHLHGEFYLKEPGDNSPPPLASNNRKTPEFDFRRCLRLEDDFSRDQRTGRLWKIDSVSPADGKLIATPRQGGILGKPHSFDLLTSTRFFQGSGFTGKESLQPGQEVLLNLTWSTLYGPGRVLDLWLDQSSRELATRHQLEKHRNHVRERGLPGWVEAVDDDAQIVTITFFSGVDPALLAELTATNPDPLAPPGSAPPAPRGTIAVARPSLMTYDPVNDRKGGPILDLKQIPLEPGSSGVQIRVQCDLLLEGFRPQRIVRFYPATWKVVALPREEQFFGRE